LSDTPPPFLEAVSGQRIAFIHISSDLNSSAKYILESTVDLLMPLKVIVLDMFYGYP
jgi:hypothetical protein